MERSMEGRPSPEELMSEEEATQKYEDLVNGRPRLVRMFKDSEELYVHTALADHHKIEIIHLYTNGWRSETTIGELPNYIPLAAGLIKKAGFRQQDWGYVKESQ